MGFFEALLILAVVVFLPLASLKLILDYRREREGGSREKGGTENALTLGELKSMMREVAQEANAPLLERIEELERFSQTTYDAVPDDEGGPLPPRTVGRRIS